jgi:hypothetical protein
LRPGQGIRPDRVCVRGIYHPGGIPRGHLAADYTASKTMRRSLVAPNLTAVLALAALADLVLFRIASAAFLPSHGGTTAERWLAGVALFTSNLSGVLGLVLAVAALLFALGTDQIFPRSMRITVSTIGLFFCALAGIGVLGDLAPNYRVHLRISQGFLAFFLAFGSWHGARAWRAKLGITLFAVPLVLQALAIFYLRMGWVRPTPAAIARVAHVMTLAAMMAAPLLVTPWPASRLLAAITIASGVLLAAAGTAATVLRFDLVQAALFYGLRIDLVGLTSTPERIYSGALIVAFSCVGASIAGCLCAGARARLAGWGLLLLSVAGAEMSSPRPALFALCGLLALAVASAAYERPVADQGTAG